MGLYLSRSQRMVHLINLRKFENDLCKFEIKCVNVVFLDIWVYKLDGQNKTQLFHHFNIEHISINYKD